MKIILFWYCKDKILNFLLEKKFVAKLNFLLEKKFVAKCFRSKIPQGNLHTGQVNSLWRSIGLLMHAVHLLFRTEFQ